MAHGFYTPLRYPGGKGRLAEYVKAVLETNDLVGGIYVEPYAGGAAVAIELLLLDYVDEIHINDLNRSIFSFWHEVLNNPDRLVDKIENANVTIDEWHLQKRIQTDSTSTLQELAYSTFFLNRCNRSGIIKGGVIGGKEQTGQWKLDARFNKTDLIARIRQIARFSDRVTLHNRDAAELVGELTTSLPRRTLFYLDPPYYVKGKGLYDSFYSDKDHAEIASVMKTITNQFWMVSYDDVPRVGELYRWARCFRYRLSYSAQTREQGGEIMFFSDAMNIPPIPRNVKMHVAA